MRLRIPSRAFLFSLIPLCAIAQQHNPQYGLNGQPLNPQFPVLVEQQRLDAWFLHTMGNDQAARPEKLPDGISKLDLMAPGKARSEYDKGFVELYRQNLNRAVVCKLRIGLVPTGIPNWVLLIVVFQPLKTTWFNKFVASTRKSRLRR